MRLWKLWLVATRRDNRLWKFPDALLSNSSFREGLHNQMRDVIKQFVENHEDIALKDLQNMIDYNQHDSYEVFNKVIIGIREFCNVKSKEYAEKRKKREEDAIKKLIDARNQLDKTQPTQQQIDDYQKALDHLKILQTARHSKHIRYYGLQAASLYRLCQTNVQSRVL